MTKKLLGPILALAVGAVVGAANGPAVQADSDSAKAAASREHLIKAAILYNFAKFTEWPAEAFADSKAPLRLCVLGEDNFYRALAALEGRTVKNRPIVARRLASADSPGKCHLLFVSASAGKRLRTILESLRGRPVLAVGDAPRFARSGGTIRLETANNRIRFEINIEAVRFAKLKLDSRLLRLGTIVGTSAASLPQRPELAEEATNIATILSHR